MRTGGVMAGPPPRALSAGPLPRQRCSHRLRVAAEAKQLNGERPSGSHQGAQGRRTLILASLSPASFPLLASSPNLQDELSLFGQEVDFYRRKAGKKLRDLLGKADPPPPPPEFVTDPVDEGLAQLLLQAPLEALDNGEVAVQWSREKYDSDYQTLYTRELPYFRDSGACGNCGSTGAMDDRQWVDFLSYLQWKALSQQLTGSRTSSSPAYWEAMHSAMPTNDETEGVDPDTSKQLRRVVGRRILQEAQASMPRGTPDGDAIHSTSPTLDDIRKGVKSVLNFFQSKGYVVGNGFVQFGMSRDEFENYATWEIGEPAFVKYWLKGSLTQRSSAALELEEGFSQDFIGSTVVAYLDQCGIQLTGYRRLRSLVNPMLVAEQATLRRRADLPAGWDSVPSAPFRLELCPDGQETGCY